MATTTGLLQQIKWSGGMPTACVWLGPQVNSAELFFIQLRASDSDAVRDYKRSMLHLLSLAQIAGYEVSVGHAADSAEVTSVAVGGFDISPIGAAVHGDFYALSGSEIPNRVEIVFDSDAIEVTVTPDFVRPHWVFVAQLPSAIPVGRNTVRLRAPGWSSDRVPIEVYPGPPQTVRVLYSGAPRDRPYTIIFVANPAIEAAAGGTFSSDPVLSNRTGYHDAVDFCLRNLLAVTEQVLRGNNLDASIRCVSIFDSTLAAVDANSLAHEINPNLMETRRDRLNRFLGRYSASADIVFVLHGSTTHTRATAWFTSDDATKPDTSHTYDGVSRVHGHFPRIPGSAAIPITVNQTGLTALHELGHAASDFTNGRVVDLYVDGCPGGYVINKKCRAANTDPIPANFATYNGVTYPSDQNRNALGYPGTWVSYHPELVDPTRPNLMDNYWLAFDDPQRCQLDRLTFDWFSERLNAKVFR